MESVAGQNYPNVEHLVVDGGSTDGTVDLLRGGQASWWISEPDRGIFDAMNKAVRAARGEWLYFLGADDSLAAPDVIARCVPEFATDAAVVFGDVRYVGGPRVRSAFGPRLLLRNAVHHQGAFYARELFEGWGYDPAFRLVADYELNLRVYLAHRRVVRVDVVIAECGEGGASRTQLRRAFRETNLVRRRHLGPVANAPLAVAYAGEFALSRILLAWRRHFGRAPEVAGAP